MFIIQSKYKLITDDLIKKIATGFFAKGDKFYSEAEIRQVYSVSSTTAVKVMDGLVRLGKVERFQGKGTFVSKNNTNELLMVSDLPLRTELVKRIEIQSVSEESDPYILDKLNIKESYYKVTRIYHIGNDSISNVNFSYIPKEFIKAIHLKTPDDFSSIYKLYFEDFNINAYNLPFKQDNSIKVLPNDFLINSFDPDGYLKYSYYQERTTFLPDGKILEFIADYMNPELFAQRLSRDPS